MLERPRSAKPDRIMLEDYIMCSEENPMQACSYIRCFGNDCWHTPYPAMCEYSLAEYYLAQAKNTLRYMLTTKSYGISVV